MLDPLERAKPNHRTNRKSGALSPALLDDSHEVYSENWMNPSSPSSNDDEASGKILFADM
jgi:hypothetical protein